MENKNNRLIVVLLIIIIGILIALCVLFATGTTGFNNNNNTNNDNNNESPNINSQSIQTKLVDNVYCNNSEITFNGINVKMEQDGDDVCMLKSFKVNGKDIKNNLAVWVDSYEIFDNNLIILSGGTSGSWLYIYNITNDSIIMKLEPETLNGYWVNSYKTENNKLIIDGRECGEQCGIESTGKEIAEFEVEYLNGNFSTPKLIG